MEQDILRLKEHLPEDLETIRDEESLEEFRISYLGKKGLLQGLFSRLGSLPSEERPAAGKAINDFRSQVESALKQRKGEIHRAAEEEVPPGFDPSMPAREPWIGRRHVLSSTMEEIIDIFRGMGFSVAEGPEVELDYYNFQALNFPDDHPARDLQDTFFVDDEVLLRTHTSPVQVRTMEEQDPPVRIVIPGRVFRNEAIDATHAAEFHQLEGLYVDEGVSMGDLITSLTRFAREFFGPDTEMRFRPHFFPFTEPSAEADMTCFACHGSGCRVCGDSGWIEIMGAGMVHPNVLTASGYDPERYTGFAFGMGIERLAMLRHGIRDIRLFLENDIRFLSQF
ncbi:MAG: phenylalanine--tRNA ligase subunit alpha [Candidatus Krumholzibacteria bacterium]|nr:phenylalanine--tRNA ligase subunit alpha [Candidatus Krumholzibacteria bacterium]MDP6669173.1 phenylalanine--tRNA ligase subunit alpha [Candidatus Krumholzibacteria bacterium]MDP6797947.1 phenylalanine--tRNA ligase subunit alpha [Candidatus Krumholzibacteria bacterium]MDP7020859.1 phenylalanine--tRNA ligase subunit alpha [Candidatus Krumholzibacteria bacterium]